MRALAILLATVIVTTSGCVRVRAHERGNLSKRGLAGDKEVGEHRFQVHERGAREGADGGTGQPGGGCGCN